MDYFEENTTTSPASDIKQPSHEPASPEQKTEKTVKLSNDKWERIILFIEEGVSDMTGVAPQENLDSAEDLIKEIRGQL